MEEFREYADRSVILWNGKKSIHREKKPMERVFATVKKTMGLRFTRLKRF